MKLQVAAVAMVALMAATGCDSVWLPLSGPVVVIEPALTPRMTVQEVTSRVLEQIHLNEQIAGRVVKPARILRITATTRDNVGQLEPGIGREERAVPGVVWLVRAEGTFATNRGRAGVEVPVASTGFYVISDADGSVIAFGFP